MGQWILASLTVRSNRASAKKTISLISAWKASYMLAQGNALGGFNFGPEGHLNASPGQRPGGL
jgi:hypothetical protein